MPLTSPSSLLHSWELNTYLNVMSNTLYKDHGVFVFFSFSILYHHSQQPVSELPMPWGQCLLSQRHSLYLRITCTRGQQQKEWWDFLHYSDFSIFLVLVSHYAVIRVLFTVLESFVLPLHQLHHQLQKRIGWIISSVYILISHLLLSNRKLSMS